MAETQPKQYKGKYTGQQIDDLLGRVPGIDSRLSAIEQNGSDKTYIHNQSSLSRVWTVIHNLGKRPSVTVTDNDGNVVEADIKYIDHNVLTVSFGISFTGKVYCN